MRRQHHEAIPRAERFLTRKGVHIDVRQGDADPATLGEVGNISRTGLLMTCRGPSHLAVGDCLESVQLAAGGRLFQVGGAQVARRWSSSGKDGEWDSVAFAFALDQRHTLEALGTFLRRSEYVTRELAEDHDAAPPSTMDASDYTLDMFQERPDPDLLAKCAAFRPWVDDLLHKQLYQRLWRVTMTGALDHRIVVFDPVRRVERSLICFDSNSYLGLHLHPRVVERVRSVVAQVGIGTASAQMLCGTSRHLRELEESLSEFLGREDTILFPTGFAANVGTIGALVRGNDVVARDRFAHASIHEGCKASAARFSPVFAHNDMKSLSAMLARAEAAGCDGKLIVTDGVFSMHGRIAPLPDLVAAAKQHRARLMIDDAHGLGVLGATGRGIEEHFGMPGTIDVLMGTLSKSLGATGGFVSGSKDLIYYLRFYAATGMFTTALPAATCAGVREALAVLCDEPEHLSALWRNIRAFVPALRAAGFIVPDPVSPIVTVFLGMHTLLLEFSRELFDAGIKCGIVMYPAVPKGESILRLTLNARHTPEELDRAVETLTRIGRRWDILHRSPEEIREIGRKVRLREHARPPHPAA